MTPYCDVAIVLAVESNKGVRTGQGEKYRYEDELIFCCQMWRHNGGQYKDIPIYAVCPSENTLPESTQERLRKLGVVYVERFMSEVNEHPCAWYNKPLIGKWFEGEYDYKKIVHIDLDCYLIKEPDDTFFDIKDGCEAKVAYYTCDEQNDFESGLLVEYNTGCIVAHKGFFSKWYEGLMGEFNNCYKSHRYYCELEEAILSFGWFDIDDWYNPTIEDITLSKDFDIRPYHEAQGKYYFLHEHVSDTNIIEVSRVITKVYGLNNGQQDSYQV